MRTEMSSSLDYLGERRQVDDRRSQPVERVAEGLADTGIAVAVRQRTATPRRCTTPVLAVEISWPGSSAAG